MKRALDDVEEEFGGNDLDTRPGGHDEVDGYATAAVVVGPRDRHSATAARADDSSTMALPAA